MNLGRAGRLLRAFRLVFFSVAGSAILGGLSTAGSQETDLPEILAEYDGGQVSVDELRLYMNSSIYLREVFPSPMAGERDPPTGG